MICLKELKKLGVEVVQIDYKRHETHEHACQYDRLQIKNVSEISNTKSQEKRNEHNEHEDVKDMFPSQPIEIETIAYFFKMTF
ncbi:hypothetical protein Glove_180g91 [Diversispora epigaea]|uniref:Uncharacterized protein n=1 Tax=Diversispora epigaea TaxID=1348612 RepID=A0A397IMZ5_9GLOM|nr:hypothetical protein Glove_180g91 [Diversispora epigaea]